MRKTMIGAVLATVVSLVAACDAPPPEGGGIAMTQEEAIELAKSASPVASEMSDSYLIAKSIEACQLLQDGRPASAVVRFWQSNGFETAEMPLYGAYLSCPGLASRLVI